MSEPLTRDVFEHVRDTEFSVSLDDGRSVELLIVEVTEKTPRGFPGEQFSVVFQGPHEPELDQRIYPMEHAELGHLDLFLVPIGAPDEGRLYEAFFNRMSKKGGMT